MTSIIKVISAKEKSDCTVDHGCKETMSLISFGLFVKNNIIFKWKWFYHNPKHFKN